LDFAGEKMYGLNVSYSLCLDPLSCLTEHPLITDAKIPKPFCADFSNGKMQTIITCTSNHYVLTGIHIKQIIDLTIKSLD